jgi:hypothetical protein
MWSDSVPLSGEQRERNMSMGNYQNFGAQFGHSATSDIPDPDFGFDFYDQSYMQHDTAMGDYSMSTARRPQAEMLSHHSSTSAVPCTRRVSSHSVAASSIVRPLSAYADSSYFTSSGAISPVTSTVHHNYIPGQEPFSPNTSDIFSPSPSEIFEYAGYESSGAPTMSRTISDVQYRLENSVAASSPNEASDGDTASSSPSAVVAEYNAEAPPRSHQLYHVLPAEDGYYYCPYAATENCGHEPKQLKCEYELVEH